LDCCCAKLSHTSNNETVSREEFFKDKKVVMFGVPGAFTPVCTQKHVPSFLNNIKAIKDHDIDTIACVSVNDPFVMKAWAKECNAPDDITFIADWEGSFSKELGLDIDLSAANLGVRSKRFALIVDNGKVVRKYEEVSPGELDLTSAEKILTELSDPVTFNDSDSD